MQLTVTVLAALKPQKFNSLAAGSFRSQLTVPVESLGVVLVDGECQTQVDVSILLGHSEQEG